MRTSTIFYGIGATDALVKRINCATFRENHGSSPIYTYPMARRAHELAGAPLGFRGAPLGFRGFPLGFHAALLSIFRKKFYNPRPIAAKSAGYSSLPRVPRVFCGGSGGAAAART